MHRVLYGNKARVWGLTKAAALEGRDHGIVVSALHPGNVRVERRMNEGSNTAGSGVVVSDGGELMMSMEEIADACLHMAALPPHVNFLEAIAADMRAALRRARLRAEYIGACFW